jgi:hypothetical protein
LENIQTPLTKNCQKEQFYCKLRETKLNTIPFVYPEVNQSVYDFMVNGYKIQEKTAIMINKKNYYTTTLAKHKNGQKNNPYEQGDNNFYWINLQDKETFYIIPETILVQQQIISSENKKGKKYLSFAERNIWLNDYKYSYNEENINEIITNYFKNFNETNDFGKIIKVFNISTGLKKKVIRFSLENKLIDCHESLSEASRKTGVGYQSISRCCENIYKTAGRFIWKYSH